MNKDKKKLFKTTIVIWSEDDPSNVELTDLAFGATDGLAFCSKQKTELVEDRENDPDWVDTEFFNDDY